MGTVHSHGRMSQIFWVQDISKMYSVFHHQLLNDVYLKFCTTSNGYGGYDIVCNRVPSTVVLGPTDAPDFLWR